MNAWEMPQVQALGEERLRLMQEAAEKCRGKSGMERLDIFLEYGEMPSAGTTSVSKRRKSKVSKFSSLITSRTLDWSYSLSISLRRMQVQGVPSI